MSEAWLYRGKVGHVRLGEQANAFAYDSLFLCFPLSGKDRMKNRLFSLERWNLFSFHERDHGDGVNGEAWVRGILASHGIDRADGDVWLQTMPRIFGFVFNPVSFWYCHDRTGGLRAVLCEVNNTFGERHCYLLSDPAQALITSDSLLRCDKVFHVSPFYPVRGEYRFGFTLAPDSRRVQIDYWQDDKLMLRTRVGGDAIALTELNLLKTLARFGWATLFVVLRINWQAFRLWRKGATFHRKPAPPALEITK